MLAVYATGNVDVACGVDSSVGILLLAAEAAEHGLKKLWLLGGWVLQHNRRKRALRGPQQKAVLGCRLPHQRTRVQGRVQTAWSV